MMDRRKQSLKQTLHITRVVIKKVSTAGKEARQGCCYVYWSRAMGQLSHTRHRGQELDYCTHGAHCRTRQWRHVADVRKDDWYTGAGVAHLHLLQPPPDQLLLEAVHS